MAFDPSVRISFQRADGEYYVATQQEDNTWIVTTTPTLTYLPELQQNWTDTEITFERNMDYYGLFRAQSANFVFAKAARAILLDILYSDMGGVNAYCLMKVYRLNEDDFSYPVFYEAEINFTTNKDDKQLQKFPVTTLQSKLLELLKAKSGSNINIPFWVYDDPDWTTDATFIDHTALKLLFEINYIGGEAAGTPFAYLQDGWNLGEHGAGANAGFHTLPALNEYNIVRNNGATTFIGNDILEPILKTAQQMPRFNEVNFLDGGNLYSQGNFVVKPLDLGVYLNFEVSGKVDGDITFGPTGGVGAFTWRVVIFEIDVSGEPPQTTPGFYDIFATLFTYNLGNTGVYTPPSSGVFTGTQLLLLDPNKQYVMGIIYDETAGVGLGNVCAYVLSDLRLRIYSNYNSGTSTPVQAPTLPASTIISYPVWKVWEKLVNLIDSTTTDSYGMPIETGVGYVGASDFLSDTAISPADNYDNVPAYTMMTTENALRYVVGYPYLSVSIASFFTMCNKIWGCGLGLEGADTLRIEKLSYFFDAATEILDLGENVANFEVIPMVEVMGNHINAGYSDLQLNKNFGCDSFCIPCEFDTPLNKTVKVLDYQATEVTTDQYWIEKARAQNNNDSGTPSASNTNILLEISSVDSDTVDIEDPSGNTQSVTAWELLKYPTAQSTDPTAATDPYVYGMYYPDTAINLGLTPKKNILRNGDYLRSICDQCDTLVISYRKQYQQQYKDFTTPALALPGISTNLNAGLVSEVEDIAINTLTARIFRPYIFQFDTGYPVNMKELIDANPYGYISFTWQGVAFAGFIYKVTQNIGTMQSTNMQLIAHPDTTNEQLKMN